MTATNITLGIAVLLVGFLPHQPLSRYTVVDLDSGEPVAYASVHPVGAPQQVTLSIEDGSFELAASSPADTLVFSHISYGVQYVPVSAIQRDTVRLRSRDFTLDEVAIVSETAESIFRKVIKAIGENHDFNQTPYFSQSWKAISSLDRDTLHAFFELDGFILFREAYINQAYSELRSRTFSGTGLGATYLKERPLYSNNWMYFTVGGGEGEDVLDHARRVKQFEVRTIGTYREGAYEVMELELTPKAPNVNRRYTLFIDLDSYAVIRFVARDYPAADEAAAKDEMYEYEERFVEIDGVWHRLYLRSLKQRTFQGREVLEEEVNLARIAEWDATKQANARPFTSRITNEPITNFQIPWDDSYWESRSSVPWSHWVTERLKAKGLTRQR